MYAASTRSQVFLALASSSPSRPGTARQALLDRPGSTCPALQAQLYRNGSASTSLHRHWSPGATLQASPKYAETTQRADVGVSGAGPKARQVDLVRLQRHGFTGTLQAWLDRTRLYRHGSIVARLDRHTCTLQARLYTGTALFRPGFIQARLYRHGFIQARLYRHGSKRHDSTGTAQHARPYRNGSTGTALQARLYRQGSTGTTLQAWLCKATRVS